MDLRTLKENLERGAYAEKDEFYADAKRIFDNAVLFNKDRSESSWVVDLAKRMAKAFEKLRKSAEKKAARLAAAAAAAADEGGGGEPKPPPGKEAGEKEKKKGEPKAGGKEGKKKKINIKMKRQKSTSSVGEISKSSSVDSADEAKPAKKSKTKKLKLKLSAGNKSLGGESKKEAKKSSGGSEDGAKTKAASKPPDVAGVPMNTSRRQQCYKIISGLKRRQPSACKWFHKPVTDPAIVKDYKEKISNPTDLSLILSK